MMEEEERVLRKWIIWKDKRRYREEEEMDEEKEFREIKGNKVFKRLKEKKIVWVERKEEDILERIRKVLMKKDYMSIWIKGEYI